MVRTSSGSLLAAVERGWGCGADTNSGGGIYRSTDNGISWLKVGTLREYLSVLAQLPDGTLFASTDTGVYRSTDGGAQWKHLGFVGAWGLATSGDGWAFTTVEKVLWRSSDGGVTWSQKTTPWPLGNLLAQRDGEVVAIGDGKVLRSTNRGDSWSTLDSGLSATLAYVYSISSGGPGRYLCCTNIGPFIWKNGAWSSLHGEEFQDAYPENIALSESGYLYASSWQSVVRSSAPVVAVNDDAAPLADDWCLEQNYPNPFNPSTTIRFDVAHPELTVLKVYDLLGREVAVLVNERKSPGSHSVRFDASGLASGVYLYTLRAGSFIQTRKLLLLR